MPSQNSAPRRADHQSLARLVDAAAEAAPDAHAVVAPGRAPLSYGGLRLHVSRTREALRAFGVGRHDRVAVVVPRGPELAVTAVAVAASAACAPLNAELRASEFGALLDDLDPKVLIVQADPSSAAAAAARDRGIPVIELIPDPGAAAGIFTLSGIPRGKASIPEASQPGDIALLLHTSGTTARPRLVPLANANLIAGARAVAEALALHPQDRCLNVMPLFHIHGLVAAVLATFATGGSVVCPAGSIPANFFPWLDEFHPTWYTAAPAIHQTILFQASHRSETMRHCSLRIIRSCSAPLPGRVTEDLERTFGAAVVEAYGMTECSHQICSNPAPPGKRKRGSVGPATGCEVAILDAAGGRAPAGTRGEVVVRGPGVTAGYVGDAAANADAFQHGWLRTGDLGRIDRDGYLFLDGRIKEIINRGGEKIAPREVEEVLMGHPAVARAVVFPVPHPILGEDVGAAVVKRARTTERDLRLFAAERLANFKVPARIRFVDHIPQGATGKVQRAALAERFAAELRTTFAAPADELERALAEMWTRVLETERVGVHDNFFEIGGYSLAAARMLADIETLTGRRLPMAALFEAPTIAEMAAVLRSPASAKPWPCLVAVQPRGSRPPFFCVHGESGNVLEYHRLASQLDADQPLYGLQARGLDGVTPPHTSIDAMAADYLNEVRNLRPEGPYLIGGLGIGGLVALEMARRLDSAGHRVALLALLDTFFNTLPPEALMPAQRLPSLLAQRLTFHWQNMTQIGPCDTPRLTYARRTAGAIIGRAFPALGRLVLASNQEVAEQPQLAITARIQASHRQAEQAYAPRAYRGRMTVFLARHRTAFSRLDPRLPWGLAHGGIEMHQVPGNHWTMAHSWPHVRVLGQTLQMCLNRAMEPAVS